MAEKRHKVAIGSDGTTHVDNEPKGASRPATSGHSTVDPDGTIHMRHNSNAGNKHARSAYEIVEEPRTSPARQKTQTSPRQTVSASHATARAASAKTNQTTSQPKTASAPRALAQSPRTAQRTGSTVSPQTGNRSSFWHWLGWSLAWGVLVFVAIAFGCLLFPPLGAFFSTPWIAAIVALVAGIFIQDEREKTSKK